MRKAEITSFEAGVVAALGAVALYLRSRPDYDEKELKKFVNFFKNTRQDAADPIAFNIALDAIGGDLSNIEEAIKSGVGSTPK